MCLSSASRNWKSSVSCFHCIHLCQKHSFLSLGTFLSEGYSISVTPTLGFLFLRLAIYGFCKCLHMDALAPVKSAAEKMSRMIVSYRVVPGISIPLWGEEDAWFHVLPWHSLVIFKGFLRVNLRVKPSPEILPRQLRHNLETDLKGVETLRRSVTSLEHTQAFFYPSIHFRVTAVDKKKKFYRLLCVIKHH